MMKHSSYRLDNLDINYAENESLVSCPRCPENNEENLRGSDPNLTWRKFCRFLGFMWISHWWMLLMLAKFGSELLIAPGGPGLPLIIIGFWNGAVIVIMIMMMAQWVRKQEDRVFILFGYGTEWRTFATK